ncbi:putative sensor histidine kinase [Blattamonas nauphoetae]|uniref:Sensor histidine kinase n=1 Tax=Blattamonas nauphoetae TaxID=2049346 RepID=A0ABQ9Y3Q4_9EUKA|nr:putative sensor histidine kinase [Blattamonas nauphoetae]
MLEEHIVLDGAVGSGNENDMDSYVIDEHISLTTEQKTKVVFHSFQNVLTSLVEGIEACITSLDDPSIPIFQNTLAVGGQIMSQLDQIANLVPLLLQLPDLVPVIVGEIGDARNVCDSLSKQDPEDDLLQMKCHIFTENLDWVQNDLIPIILTRVGGNGEAPSPPFECVDCATGLVLSEKERTKAGMHVLHLNVRGPNGSDWIAIPPIFQDIMRDILMNARKYCYPGGTLWGEMVSNGETVTIKVKDNGRGIPEDEVRQCVHFGFRGSNVTDRRTLGAGYGLTKAYVFTKQFGGTFEIRTRLGVGTVFLITLPVPKSFRVILPPEEEIARAVLDEKQREQIEFQDSAILAMPKETYTRPDKGLRSKFDGAMTRGDDCHSVEQRNPT